MPDEIAFKVVEDFVHTVHLILPERPAELSDAGTQSGGGRDVPDTVAHADNQNDIVPLKTLSHRGGGLDCDTQSRKLRQRLEQPHWLIKFNPKGE